jgi:hypothetical protein
MYCTLAELQTHARITDSADDPVLLAAIAAATERIENHCSRQFTLGPLSERLFFRDSPRLCVVDDIGDRNELTVRTDDDNDGAHETVWTATDYQLEPLNGVTNGVPGRPFTQIRAVGDYTFPSSSLAPVMIHARWGWPEIPPSVRTACLLLSAHIVLLRGNALGISGVGESGFSIRIQELPHVARLLQPFARHPVGYA